jgi:F0F1-type ATP synthase membrane subunit a
VFANPKEIHEAALSLITAVIGRKNEWKERGLNSFHSFFFLKGVVHDTGLRTMLICALISGFQREVSLTLSESG